MTASPAATVQLPADSGGVWEFVDARPSGPARPDPQGAFAIVRLNKAAFDRAVRLAPKDGSGRESNVILALPIPGRTLSRFRVTESPMLAPELAAAFPDIRTYRGQGIDDPSATVRFGWTEKGFHALLLTSSGEIYIDPYGPGDLEYYITMRKAR